MARVIVVGGGAAGLMAAYASAARGNSVILLEQNEKLGKKIYITGKGRCNLTNDGLPDEFLQNVVHGAKFMTGAIYSFSPQKTMAFLESYGLAVKTERGNRVFPMSDHASDVTKTLEKACLKAGVMIKLNEKVAEIKVVKGSVRGVISSQGQYDCDCAVICTGGLTYPSTGSTGDGYRFASACGHSVSPCVPSLTGIKLMEDCASVQGIALKNVVLSARCADKVISSRMGELLFTHYGISGPLVLSLSAEINRMPLKDITLSIDYKPSLDVQKLNARLLRDFSERSNERLKNVMRGLLPQNLAMFVLNRAGVSSEKQANSVTKEERLRLVKTLKEFVLKPADLCGFHEAVVTSGGVNLKEVNPKTMESKIVKGLYFGGEVLDIDAFTGGFNLQLAFSSGFIAGNSINV